MFDIFKSLLTPNDQPTPRTYIPPNDYVEDSYQTGGVYKWDYQTVKTVPDAIIRLEQDATIMLHAVDLIFGGCSAKDLPYDPGCKIHRLIMWGFVDKIEDRFGKSSEVAEQARQCNTIEEAITLVEVLKL